MSILSRACADGNVLSVRLHRASRFFDRSTVDHVARDGSLTKAESARSVTVTFSVASDESVSLPLFFFVFVYLPAFIVPLHTFDFLEIKSCTFIKVSHRRFNFPYLICKLFLYLDGTTIRFLDSCVHVSHLIYEIIPFVKFHPSALAISAYLNRSIPFHKRRGNLRVLYAEFGLRCC